DPYGQVTTIVTTGTGSAKTTKITEPGGRYLKVSYDANGRVTQVQAFDGVNAQPIQSVTYTWTTETLRLDDGVHPASYTVLTRADYSDGTYATSAYNEGAYPGDCICTYPYYSSPFYAARLATADDVRYPGPMRGIAYKYYTLGNGGNGTRNMSENHLVNGAAGEMVSSINALTETRGDGAQRTFTYYKGAGGDKCAEYNCTEAVRPDPLPTNGKLQTYTDFLANT